MKNYYLVIMLFASIALVHPKNTVNTTLPRNVALASLAAAGVAGTKLAYDQIRKKLHARKAGQLQNQKQSDKNIWWRRALYTSLLTSLISGLLWHYNSGGNQDPPPATHPLSADVPVLHTVVQASPPQATPHSSPIQLQPQPIAAPVSVVVSPPLPSDPVIVSPASVTPPSDESDEKEPYGRDDDPMLTHEEEVRELQESQREERERAEMFAEDIESQLYDADQKFDSLPESYPKTQKPPSSTPVTPFTSYDAWSELSSDEDGGDYDPMLSTSYPSTPSQSPRPVTPPASPSSPVLYAPVTPEIFS